MYLRYFLSLFVAAVELYDIFSYIRCKAFLKQFKSMIDICFVFKVLQSKINFLEECIIKNFDFWNI